MFYKSDIIKFMPSLENLDGVYIKKAGMKVKLTPSHGNYEEKKTEKPEENINAYKKSDAGFKLKDEILDQEEAGSEEDDEEERTENGKKLVNVIEYTSRYTKKPLRSMKLRSEGNRFVKNEML